MNAPAYTPFTANAARLDGFEAEIHDAGAEEAFALYTFARERGGRVTGDALLEQHCLQNVRELLAEADCLRGRLLADGVRTCVRVFWTRHDGYGIEIAR